MTTSANDFTTGSIPRKMLKFMTPVLGALALQAMYGAVDMLIVGQFGTVEGLSAVATGSNVINIFTTIIAGLTMGITVLIGQYTGRGEKALVGDVVGGAVCFFICLGAVFTLLTIVLAAPFTVLMQAPAESFESTVEYIVICGAGTVFIIGYNVISGIFRGIGNSRQPLFFVTVACVANIVLDLLFVAGFHMNVAGAALATVIAQALSVLMSFAVIRKSTELSFTRKKIRFNKEIAKFLQLGFPLTLQMGLSNISFLLILAIINNLGLSASSGFGIAQKIISFIMLIPATLTQSVSAFVAQNIGAKLPQRAKRATWVAIASGASVGVAIFLVACFQGEVLAKLFTDDTAVMIRAAEYLKGFSPEPIITCVSFSLIGYFNGCGRTVFSMVQSLAQAFLIRIPFTYIMSLRSDVTLTHIGLAVPASTMFGIFLCVGYYVYLEKSASGISGVSYRFLSR